MLEVLYRFERGLQVRVVGKVPEIGSVAKCVGSARKFFHLRHVRIVLHLVKRQIRKIDACVMSNGDSRQKILKLRAETISSMTSVGREA